MKKKYLDTTLKCQHMLLRHPAKTMAEELQILMDESINFDERDVYGNGDLISSFEVEIAGLLGKPAAIFLPSGTMAQPIALRIWAEEKGKPWFAMHPTSHLELHEFKGYQSLHKLNSVLIGDIDQVPDIKDLKRITDPVSSIVLELPMREIGGQLPLWDDLIDQSSWARQQGIALHMDGARLWQCPSYYNKSLAEISSLFDSIYVSLYKDLGGISGSVLVGPEWFIESARTWARRAGGNLYSFYPYILSAKAGLRALLPSIPKAAVCASWAAEFFNQQSGMHTTPKIPQTNMFHLYIKGDANNILAKANEWSLQNNIAVLPLARNEILGHCCFEMNFGTNVLQQEKEWWIEQLTSFVACI